MGLHRRLHYCDHDGAVSSGSRKPDQVPVFRMSGRGEGIVEVIQLVRLAFVVAAVVVVVDLLPDLKLHS